MNNQNLKSIKDNNTYNNIMNTTFEETLENLPISTEQLFESLGETALELIGEYLDTNEYYTYNKGASLYKVIEKTYTKKGKLKSKTITMIDNNGVNKKHTHTTIITYRKKKNVWIQKGENTLHKTYDMGREDWIIPKRTFIEKRKK